jgi:hypothetical protein
MAKVAQSKQPDTMHRRDDAEPPPSPPTSGALVPVTFSRLEFVAVEQGAARAGLPLTRFIARAALDAAAALEPESSARR